MTPISPAAISGTGGGAVSLWCDERGRMDMLQAVLGEWDLGPLQGLVLALRACVGQLRADDDACDTTFVREARLPLATRSDLRCHPVATLLEQLTHDMTKVAAPLPFSATPLAIAEQTRMRARAVATARAWFLILLHKDGRVRRLAMTDDPDTHPVMGTRPPDRDRFIRFLELGGLDAGERYLAHLVELASLPEDARPLALGERLHQLTQDFVQRVHLTWVPLCVPHDESQT